MLSRLALRLAAVEALTGATIAGARVYDSRVDPIAAAATEAELDAALAEFEDKPVLVVYTEEDEARPFDGARVPIRDRVVTLVVEALIASRGQVEVSVEGGSALVPAFDARVTDREREALLDLLEAQVGRILIPEHAAPGAAAALYRRVAREARSLGSSPLRAGQDGLRRCLRTISLHVQVAQDDWTGVAAGAVGLDRLPQPLRAVAAALPPQSGAAQLCAGLAPLVAPPPAAEALDGVNLYAALGRPADRDDHDVRAALTSPKTTTQP